MPINRDVYIADDTKPNKRRKIVKPSKVDLIDTLYEYYENPYNDKNKLTLAYIYPEWKAFKALHSFSRKHQFQSGTNLAISPV